MNFTPQEKEILRNYQYHGGDSSPIYKYILSPFAQFCVDSFIPVWLAPNVITFSGLIISLVAATITITVNPTLSPHSSPRWLGLLNAVSIFAYQTLDNMDGKQARKTKSSSALGMFFDHGCDAINASVIILSMGSILGTGWSGKLFMTYLSSWVPFYFQTWEEYYNGAMLLPPFNGPTEGLLMTVIICLLSLFLGTESFHVELFNLPNPILFHENTFLKELGYPTVENPTVTPFTIMLLIISICVVPTMILHTYRVVSKRIEKNLPIVPPLLNLIPFIIIFSCAFYYIIASPIGFKKYPVITGIFYCSMFAEVNIHLMLSHMCHRPLDFIHRYSIWFLVLLSFLVLSGNPKWLFYERGVLFISAIISFVTLVVEFYLICDQFSEALNIHIFQLGKKQIYLSSEKKVD